MFLSAKGRIFLAYDLLLLVMDKHISILIYSSQFFILSTTLDEVASIERMKGTLMIEVIIIRQEHANL